MEKQDSKFDPQFVSFLRNELANRCAKNPAYSLRAFSKFLGISHATLSQVMSGKRPLTIKCKKQMAIALNLSPEKFIDFQMPTHIRFEDQFQKLNLEKYDILSDVIHDSILELTHLKSFKGDPKWIAMVLDRSIHEVHAAVDKLIQHKLLSIKNNKWTDLSVNNTVNHLGDFASPALKKYQKDILEKSIEAIETLPREERDHTSLILTFASEDIGRAKNMIKEFRTQFSAKSKLKSKNIDEVYALSVSFFPITKIKSLKNKKEQK